MSPTFTELVTLVKMDCGNCGGSYAISHRVQLHHREEGGFWHCPYCQTPWGYNESENSRLRKELEQAQATARANKCEWINEQYLRKAAEEKLSAAATKLHRVRKGVCPCCKRSFTNLRRHMETKHPEREP